MVPGSTLRYGSSFCIVTRRPRERRSRPRLEAVRPLPREEATPPVTKMCFVVSATGFKSTSSRAGRDVALRPPARLVLCGGPRAGQRPRRGGTSPPLVRVAQQVVHLGSNRSRVTNWHKDARAFDKLRKPACPGGDDGDPGSHRLLHDQGPGLPPAGEDERVSGAQPLG